MRVIICTDRSEWQGFEDHVHLEMLKDGAKQVEWSEPKIHPVDGRIAFKVKEQIEKYLIDEELERVVELPDDWTPVQEEL